MRDCCLPSNVSIRGMMRNRVLFMIFLVGVGGGFLVAFEQTGIASWYGGKYQGRRTANGEVFNTYRMTAAHKTLPFGVYVEVMHLATGRRIVVRINDRGPFVKGRIIDLSYAAARRLGMARAGIARVKIRTLPPGKKSRKGRFAIRMGLFSTLEEAVRLRDKLTRDGLSPVVRKKEGAFHVRLEGISSKQRDALFGKLRRLGYGKRFVRVK